VVVIERDDLDAASRKQIGMARFSTEPKGAAGFRDVMQSQRAFKVCDCYVI
jgi:hypothetical protein